MGKEEKEEKGGDSDHEPANLKYQQAKLTKLGRKNQQYLLTVVLRKS